MSNTDKFKIATLGCSHSSYYAGTPWPIPLANLIKAELKMAYSCGAGNEMNVLKLRQLLDEYQPNLVIVQLTDPNRLTLGLDHESSKRNIRFEEYIGDHNAMGIIYYTFNHSENLQNLKRLLGKSFHKDIDELMINHIITSEYNLYHKVAHTMLAMENMARSYKTPIIFFSWSVDIISLIKNNGYSKAFADFNIIPNFIENFCRERKLEQLPHSHIAGGHRDTEQHEIIAKDFVLPYLINNNFVSLNSNFL